MKWLNCKHNPPPYGQVVSIRPCHGNRDSIHGCQYLRRRELRDINGYGAEYQDYWIADYMITPPFSTKPLPEHRKISISTMRKYEWEAPDDQTIYEDD